MKIAIVGPGIMPIPPNGWGAVETLIDEYRIALEGIGWDVNVINTRNTDEIINLINEGMPDFVHIQYDEFIDIIPELNCKNIAITSHFGYINHVWKYDEYRNSIYKKFCKIKKHYIFCLSNEIKKQYLNDGVSEERLFVAINGVNVEKFRFADNPLYPEKSICLGKIDSRKKQGMLQSIVPSVDFVGNLCEFTGIDSGFDPQRSNYLGEWTREKVYNHLTEYANLVLLSSGEAHALVLMEALAAGLGLVVSEECTANLDLTKIFIDVIPNDKINDVEYLNSIIKKNRNISISMRDEIRKYSEEFNWPNLIEKYSNNVINCLKKENSDEKNLIRKPRLIIFTVATGKYFEAFFEKFSNSIFNFLSPKYNVHIHCFVDRKIKSSDPRVIVHAIDSMSWPFPTLMKFHFIKSVINQVMAADCIMFLDVDMCLLKPIDEFILQKELFFVEHPGYINRQDFAPYEYIESESTFIQFERRKVYVQGCLFGGDPFEIKKMIYEISKKIDLDLNNSHIPIWHDESYLNWYASTVKPYYLGKEFAYPESYQKDNHAVILHLNKNHDLIRSTSNHVIQVSEIIEYSRIDQIKIFKALYEASHKKNQVLVDHLNINAIYMRSALSKHEALEREFADLSERNNTLRKIYDKYMEDDNSVKIQFKKLKKLISRKLKFWVRNLKRQKS